VLVGTTPTAARREDQSYSADNSVRFGCDSGKVDYDLYEERESAASTHSVVLRGRASLSVPDQGLFTDLAAFKQADIVVVPGGSRATWAPGTSSSTISNGVTNRAKNRRPR